MEDPAQDQHLRKKRREDLLKLHFRDLPPQDQLRLLRELIGHMEYDLLMAPEASGNTVADTVDADSLPSTSSEKPVPGRPGKHKSAKGPQTSSLKASTVSGQPSSDSSPAAPASPGPAMAQEPKSDKTPGTTPASPVPGLPGKALDRPAPLFASDAAAPGEGEADWETFDQEMDAILHAGGELNHIHRLRLKDAMDRYASLLKKNGYIKGLPGIPELVRKAQAEEQLRLAQQSRPEWNSWVAKDQETLDRPLSHQWADWLLPGTDEEEDS